MYIIIKKDGARPTTKNGRMTFTPHLNHAMDTKPIFIASEKQYDYEMKKRGLVRYDPDYNPTPKRKEYKASKETRKIVNAIKGCTNRDGSISPGGSLKRELIKRKVIRTKDEVHKIMPKSTLASIDTSKGGYF